MIATGKTKKNALLVLSEKTALYSEEQWKEAVNNALIFASSRGYINGPIN